MDFILSIVDSIMNLGPSIMMPMIIFIFGMIFKQGLSKSIRYALTIGVGFTGINIVVQAFMNTITPVTQALVENAGFHLNIVDIGWPAASGVAWSSLVGPVSIVIGVAINVLGLDRRSKNPQLGRVELLDSFLYCAARLLSHRKFLVSSASN